MKKIVPDPPLAIPFVSIIADLGADEAMVQAVNLMETLVDTVHVSLQNPPEETARDVMLDNASILCDLVVALINHAKAKGASHE